MFRHSGFCFVCITFFSMVPCTGWSSTARNQQWSSDCRHGVTAWRLKSLECSLCLQKVSLPAAKLQGRQAWAICSKETKQIKKKWRPQSCQERENNSMTPPFQKRSKVLSYHAYSNFTVAEKMEMKSTKIFWVFSLQFPPAYFHVSTFWTNMPSVSLQQSKDEQASTTPLSFRCNARKAWVAHTQCLHRCWMLRPYIPLPLGNSMAITVLPKRSTAEWL